MPENNVVTDAEEIVVDKKIKDAILKISEASTDTAIEKKETLFDPSKLGILNDVTITLTIEIGRAQIKIKDLLSLTKDSIIDLNKLAGEPVDIYANGKLISQGNIITVNGKYCVRLTSVPEKL